MNEITNTSSTPTVQFHPDTPKKTVADWVRDMRMSPSVNEKNTGIKTDQVTPDLMLATSKKLLDISRGKQEPDPKDSLDFQRFYGPAEYFAEHILRDGGKLGRNLLWKATNKGNLDFMATNALDKHISSVFYDSKLAQMMDGASPLETVDSAYKMTRLGEGGIGDIDSAPDEMRTVQPSYFGFIDPVRCYAVGTEVLTEQGWRPIEKIEKDEKVWTLEDGIPDFRPVKETLKFSYQGPMVAYEDDLVAFSVTPHHRMHVKIDGEWTKRYAEEVFNTSAVINVGEKMETQHQLLDSKWEMTKADGYVYCLTVPGGIFYCRYKKLHGLWCGNSPESLRVGLDMYATKNVMKGSDGRLYQKFINARTGKEELVDSEKAARSVVASSEMRNANTKSIFALGGPTGVRIVPKSSVDYYLPRADEAYSTSSNLVPMLSAVKEMRLLMGCLHPMTPILTLSNKNEINIVPAQEVTAKNMSIPGSDKDGQSKLYDMRNSIAKFPPKRFWFKKVTLMSGRTIVTSYDHKWPIIKNGKMVLQEARKLKEGDTVLRTTFKDVPSRRTFTRRTYVGSNVGYTMGLMARSLYLPDKGKIRFHLPSGYNCLAIEDALTSLGVKEFTIYNKMGARYVGITDEDFIAWIDKVMGIRPENRRIPSFILSARVDVVGSFINGYTLDKNLVGQDAMESYWILELPNVLFRDSIAFLLSRIGTDCLYRECHRDGQLSLALRLVEPNPAWGDMILDSIKTVQNAQSCPIMIDIDIDDNMYVTASGILTHNSKYPLQAISLEARETPLVRTLDEATGKSMQQLIGKYLGAQFAKQGGTVTAVRKDRIDVLYDDGKKGSVPLYVNFPMNAKGYISNTPSVKAGDTFKPGQLLAYSNYTDKNGDAALGINLRSAYMSWKGGTYEDAVVISESAADKLKSTTMYKTAVDLDRTVKLGKQNYMTWKPAEYTKEQMDLLDNNGIVKPGTVLHKGDPMILAVQTTEPSPGTMGKRILTDMSETWEHDHPGVVTDVVKTRKGVKVFATVTAPAEVGDKIAGLYGNKGMIAQIVPDDQMPHNAKGEPLELIMSPLGITSRTNPSQLFEAQLGKIARKTGKPETMPAFFDQDVGEYVLNRLKQNHMTPDEDLTDPETGRTIPDVLTGVSYIHKLKHLAESKMSARGTDEYTAEGLPGGKGMTGCFPAMQNIMTIHGEKSIATICEKRQPEWVLTWDGTQYCYKQVTDWFIRRSDTADLLNISLRYNLSTTGNNAVRHTTSIYPTLNHHMYKADMSVVEAGELKVGDKLAGIGFTPTEDQKSVMLGTLLGDSYRTQSNTLACMHSCKQLDFITWKYEMLKGLNATLSSGYYKTTESVVVSGRTIKATLAKTLTVSSSAAVEEIMSLVYGGTQDRHITRQVLDNLGELGLCVWMMDDGSMHNHSHNKGKVQPEAKLCTQGFSCAETEIAAAWLRDFLQEPDGVVTDSCTLQNGEVRKTIRFHRNASVKLLHMIARHVPYTAIPRSKIWLRSQVQEMQKSITLVHHDFNSKLGVVPVEIISIAPYKHDKPGVTSVPVYDFTVDNTHKYILAGGVIVSNSKRFGTLEQGAMVGHGAFDIIKDSKVIRGQSNSDFWRSIRTGGIPTMPGEPLVHKKFFAHLQGSGINVRRTPRGVSVFALSNGDIDQLAGSRELKSRDTYEAHNFRPIDGGLFGQDIFGMNGDKWAFIKLDEPLPNPVMEEPLARLLNMSDKDFVGVCSGEREVNGMSSAADVKARLQKVDLEAEAAKALQDYKTANNSNKDKMLKRYVAIEHMRRGGVQPADFMLDKIPVLPPQFRPVSSHNGLTMVADSNYLYAQLLDARDDLRESKDLPKSFQDEARRNVYDKWKELTGLYDPEDVKLREKHVQGLLKWALGTSPKFSGFQRKVLSATVDTVGRGAVVPDPRVKLNQLGIPREMAFNIMAPLVERGLVKRGYSPIDAMKMVKERKPQAEELLKEVMKTHPVLMNRAPTLHKLGIMAFDPVLVNGHVIHVNPSIVSPFGMDFDGDTVNIHAPVTDKAIQEARAKMFPERNLIAMRNREILYKPEKEYQQGLYLATHPKTDPNVRLRTFRSLDEAREAYRQGLLDINDPIEIKP